MQHTVSCAGILQLGLILLYHLCLGRGGCTSWHMALITVNEYCRDVSTYVHTNTLSTAQIHFPPHKHTLHHTNTPSTTQIYQHIGISVAKDVAYFVPNLWVQFYFKPRHSVHQISFLQPIRQSDAILKAKGGLYILSLCNSCIILVAAIFSSLKRYELASVNLALHERQDR